MGNNEPDYKDNLAFEPAMTWEDFKFSDEGLYLWEMKSKKGEVLKMEKENLEFYFWDNGDITLEFFDENSGETFEFILGKNKSYKQMQQLILALE